MKKAFWILIALLAASIAVNVWQWRHQPEEYVIVKRDTIWKDSIIREPLPAETVDIGRVVYVKVPVPGERDTVHDSIEVPVPIIQKRYEDSSYTAWVSGFRPSLDSIRLYQREIINTVTETVVEPAPRFSFGIQAGAGIGITTGKPDFYVGFGGTYNFFKK